MVPCSSRAGESTVAEETDPLRRLPSSAARIHDDRRQDSIGFRVTFPPARFFHGATSPATRVRRWCSGAESRTGSTPSGKPPRSPPAAGPATPEVWLTSKFWFSAEASSRMGHGTRGESRACALVQVALVVCEFVRVQKVVRSGRGLRALVDRRAHLVRVQLREVASGIHALDARLLLGIHEDVPVPR